MIICSKFLLNFQAGSVHSDQRRVGGGEDGEHQAHTTVPRQVAILTVPIHGMVQQ